MITNRMLVAAGLSLGLLCSSALAQEHPTPAPSPPAESAKTVAYGDWALHCIPSTPTTALPCELVQEIDQKGTNERIIFISLGYRADKDTHVIALTVPLGIYLQRGVDISIGAFNAKGVRPTRCELSGCLIFATIAGDMLQAMRSNSKGTLTMSGNGKDDIKFEFSLDGFVAGDDALKKETAARPAPAAK
jgi:invasion protein IalB